jgi:MFS family permease
VTDLAGRRGPDRPGRYRDALRNPEFRGLAVAKATSDWGDQIARVALAALVLVRTDSALLSVLAFVVSFLPAVFGSALLGGLADRLPRKVILLGCDLARLVIVSLLALLAVPSTSIWVLLFLLLLTESFLAPFEAARASILPDILTEPREYLAGANLMRMLFQVDQFIALMLGAAIIYAVGERGALFLDAVTYGISFVIVAMTLRWRPAPRSPSAPATTLWSDFRAGWRVVADDPALRAMIGLGCGAAILLTSPEAVALAYAKADGAGPAIGAALMASLPAGATVGALLVARLTPMQQVNAIVPLAVATCVPLLLTCVAPPWPVAMALWFVSGLAQGFMIPLMATVQLVTPMEFRGRVSGLAAAGFSVATAATYLLVGVVADATTPAFSLTAAAALGMAVIGLVYRSWPHGAIRRAATRVYAASQT